MKPFNLDSCVKKRKKKKTNISKQKKGREEVREKNAKMNKTTYLAVFPIPNRDVI